MIDKRLLKVGIQVGSTIRYYEDLDITASGSKTQNEIPNDFTIKITNLKSDIRNQILTETNILDRNVKNKKVFVYAGRESTGYSLIYSGDIRRTTISQPPDISLTINTYTGDIAKMETTTRTSGDLVKLSTLSSEVAKSLNKQLVFEATDKQIGNYSFSGSKLAEVGKLAESGNVNAYIDDDKLIVKDKNKSLKNSEVLIDSNSGMIGIPELNERGIAVRTLYNPNIIVGGRIRVKSELNPVANGVYIVYKIAYDLSNRGVNFYNNIEATLES